MLATLPLVLTLTAPAPAELESTVKAIFDDKCTSCHDEGDDLDLVNLGRLTEVKGATGAALVAPGDPEASYLVTKLVGGAGMEGDLMPMGDDPLPKAELDAVKQWIAALPSAGDAGAGASETPAAGADAAALEAELLALFDDRCNACHGEGADEVVLEGSLAHLTGVKGATGARMVVPGDVEASYLWTKVRGGAGMEGELMPMGDDPLSDAELALVRDYITALAGAPAGDRAEAGGGATVEVGGVGAGGIGGDTGDDAPARRDKPPFHGTFQHNLPTTAGLGKRKFEFRIDHRFGRVGTERGAFGLDAGVVMSVGFAYGIMDGWDVLIRRSNSRKGYELGTKYIPVRQEAGFPVSFGGYASLEYLRDYDTNTANPVSGNFQAMLSRLWFDRWSTMLLVGYYLRTNHAANVTVDFGDGPVAATDTRNTLGLGLASTVWLGERRRWGLDLEYHLPIPADRLHYNGGRADPSGANIGSWSLGGSYSSGLHLFQIFLTNTREIHTNLYAPGGQTKNPFENRGNFFLGFNLSRKWTIKGRRNKNRKSTKKDAR
jgi:mono/diheme cytochrome c family protein